MKKKIFVVAAIIISSHLSVSIRVVAQSVSPEQVDSSGKALDEVIITANRFPQKQNQTGKVVTVIPRVVIEKNPTRTLGELLNEQVGMTIIGSNNNLGTNQDVYTRGAATGNTLVLIDGMPAYDVSTIASTFDINFLPVNNIERIEILKGAQSTIYGSDAVAGVINIITRKKGNKPVNFYGTVAAGSYETYKVVGGIRGQTEKNSYNAQYQHLHSGGFSSAWDSTGKQDFDDDAFKQNVFSGNFSRRFNSKLEWRINGQFGNYKTDLDAGAFTDEKDYMVNNHNYQAGTGFSYRLPKGIINLNYNLNISEREYLDDSGYVSGFAKYTSLDYTGRSHFVELFTNYNLHKHFDLVAGTDYRWQNTDQRFFSVSSFGPFITQMSGDTANISLYSVYASLLLKQISGFHFELGGRYNHHSAYGNNVTFTLNPSYLLNDQWKFFANYSSAFKAPSLYQLYDPSIGQPCLKPEKSTTLESGIQFSHPSKKFTCRIVYFNRDIKDGIDFNYFDFKYFNNNRQRDHGIEWEAASNLNRLSINMNYTYVTGEVNTTKFVFDPNLMIYIPMGDTTYNNLFRRPKHSLNLGGGYQFTKQLFVRVAARFVGKHFEPQFFAAPIEMESYQTFDVYAEYLLAKKLRVFVDVRNIFDEEYFDVRGFNTRSRNFMGGISFEF